MLGKSEPKQNILPTFRVFFLHGKKITNKTKQIRESEERNLLHVASHIWGEQPPIH